MRVRHGHTPRPLAASVAIVSPTSGVSEGAPAEQSPRAWSPQGWWTPLAKVIGSPIIGRIVDDVAGDLNVLPVRAAADTGEQTPTVDLALSGAWVPTLASPIADRRATLDAYYRLMLRWGRAVWLQVTPETLDRTDGKLTEAFATFGKAWMVFSPLSVAPPRDGVLTLTHATGHTFRANESDVVLSSWWAVDQAGVLTSLVADLVHLIEADRLADAVLVHWLDMTRQNIPIHNVPAGTVTVTRQGGGGPAATADQLLSGEIVHDAPKATSQTQWWRSELLLRAAESAQTGGWSQRPRIPLASPANADGKTVDVVASHLPIDGGVPALVNLVMQRLAVAADIPTAQLTGESPKYANRFADSMEFARSLAGWISSVMASQLTPVLHAHLRSSGSATGDTANRVAWLDPAPLIDAAQSDAAATRGGSLAAAAARFPGGQLIWTPGQVKAINRWQRRAFKAVRKAVRLAVVQHRAGLAAAGADGETPFSWLLWILVELRRLVGLPTDAADIDRMAASTAAATLSEMLLGIFARMPDAPVDEVVDRAMLDVAPSVVDSLLGPSEGAGTAQMFDRPVVRGLVPELNDASIEWQWSWTPPGDPGRDAWPDHQHNDGVTRREGEAWPGHEPNGASAHVGGHKGCQCVLELVGVEALVPELATV